jgi:predicted amidohydrolase
MTMKANAVLTFSLEGLEAFADAAPEGVDLVILPELCDGGYARLEAGATAEDYRPTIKRLAGLSSRIDATLFAGSLPIRDADGQVRNTCLVFRQGTEIGRFSKTHLFRPMSDDRFFVVGQPGERLTLSCNEGSLRTGVIICYDLRFPEAVRPWFKDGLDLLVVPARWPRVRDDIWKLLLRARAVENQCFVIGVDARDDEGGGTYVFGPAGESIFALGPDPDAADPPWCTVIIDTDLISDVKERFNTQTDAILLQ